MWLKTIFLLITFANSLDSDQNRQSIGPDARDLDEVSSGLARMMSHVPTVLKSDRSVFDKMLPVDDNGSIPGFSQSVG